MNINQNFQLIMNINQNFQLFKREYPSWNTYSQEQLRQATIDFCRNHNILPTSDLAEYLYGRLLTQIPIPPLPHDRRYRYKPPKQHIPLNQSFYGIQQTHQGTIPSPTGDPPQEQSITQLNKSLKEFMKHTEKQTSSRNLLSPFNN